MSGKGDRNRVKDFKKYSENFDKIFKNKPKKELTKSGDKSSIEIKAVP